MRNDVHNMRYRIGDMLGDYAPDSFKRPTSRSEWIIGLGGILVAGGISFLAMRMADQRLDQLIRRVLPSYASRGGDEWPMAGDTSDGWDRTSRPDAEGRRMPAAPRASMFDRRDRGTRSTGDDFETSTRPEQSSGDGR